VPTATAPITISRTSTTTVGHARTVLRKPARVRPSMEISVKIVTGEMK